MTRALDIDGSGRLLATSDARGSSQLVEIAPDGTVTELTAMPGPCSGRYVPGTRTVVVSHDTDGDERAQLSLLRLDGRTAPAGPDDLEPLVHDPAYIHSLTFVDEHRLGYRTNRRNGVDFDAVVREHATGVETVVYDGGGWLVDFAVSPDRRRAARTLYSSAAHAMQLVVTELETGETTTLVPDGEPTNVTGVAWTPDGDHLVLTWNRGRDMRGVARVDVATGAHTWLVTDDAYDVTGLLSPDGARLLVETNDEGASRLAVHDATTGAKLRDLELPPFTQVGDHPLPPPVWSGDSRMIATSCSAPGVPGDALRIDPDSGTVTPVGDSAAPIADLSLSMPETHRIPAHDGESIPCAVYRPTGTPNGASVLLVHGGPEGQARTVFHHVAQALCGGGYTVLVPNVRGSDGYGKRWYSLDDKRLRLDSVADLASIHRYLPELDLDPSRSALWGGSYGGYMVLAGLAFQPDLWAAGVDIVGMSSLVTFLENTSPYRRAAREREYGSLAEDRDFLAEASPLGRIGDVRAPLFVIHGANDPRVPLSEAEQVHAAVSGNGIDCELHVYGDEGHGLSRRVNRVDAYSKALAFLDRHLT